MGSSLADRNTSLANMKVMGVLSCLLSALLLSCCTGAPAPVILPDALTNIAFTAAGGLVLTGATGSTFTIPTAALLLGKTVVLKKAVIEALFAKDALESMDEEPYLEADPYP